MSNFLRNHPGVAISMAYVYLSFVGILYEYLYMSSYGINVLNYIEPKDYLISFVKAAPFILIMLLGYALVFIKDALLNQRHVKAETLKERIFILLVKSRKAELFTLIMSLPVFALIIGNVQPNELNTHNIIKIDKKLATELNISEQLYFINSFGSYFFLATEEKQFIVRKEKLVGFELIRTNKPFKQDK